MSEEVNSLEEQAKKRQERIKSLKRKREEKNEGDDKTETKDDSNKMTLPKPKFRSYKPQDKSLNEHLINKGEAADVQKEVKDLLSLAKSDVAIDQLDISALAPRQPDWDLKRDVEKKIEKLAKRTQKAMAELIREKLKAKQDLAEVPNAPVDL